MADVDFDDFDAGYACAHRHGRCAWGSLSPSAGRRPVGRAGDRAGASGATMLAVRHAAWRSGDRGARWKGPMRVAPKTRAERSRTIKACRSILIAAVGVAAPDSAEMRLVLAPKRTDGTRWMRTRPELPDANVAAASRGCRAPSGRWGGTRRRCRATRPLRVRAYKWPLRYAAPCQPRRGLSPPCLLPDPQQGAVERAHGRGVVGRPSVAPLAMQDPSEAGRSERAGSCGRRSAPASARARALLAEGALTLAPDARRARPPWHRR